MPLPIAILIGSPSDKDRVANVVKTLDEIGVSYRLFVASAHRTPDLVTEFCKELSHQYGAIIAAAGMAAALPGAVASQTDVPVIGLPLTVGPVGLAGHDALYAMTQMPPGAPVMTVGVDACTNAALAAAQVAGYRDAFNHYRESRRARYPKSLINYT